LKGAKEEGGLRTRQDYGIRVESDRCKDLCSTIATWSNALEIHFSKYWIFIRETAFKLGETRYFTRHSSNIPHVAVRVTLSFHPAVNLMPFHHPAKES
jgi:hypothetical protein